MPKTKNIQVIVLSEPPRLKPDPPFGPAPPPSDWTETFDKISSAISLALPVDPCDPFYPVLDKVQKENAMSVIDSAMDSWFDHAEDDLIDLLGAKGKKTGRGRVQATIVVNLINTFRLKSGGSCLVSKALRWIQVRCKEFS